MTYIIFLCHLCWWVWWFDLVHVVALIAVWIRRHSEQSLPKRKPKKWMKHFISTRSIILKKNVNVGYCSSCIIGSRRKMQSHSRAAIVMLKQPAWNNNVARKSSTWIQDTSKPQLHCIHILSSGVSSAGWCGDQSILDFAHIAVWIRLSWTIPPVKKPKNWNKTQSAYLLMTYHHKNNCGWDQEIGSQARKNCERTPEVCGEKSIRA